MIPVSGLMLRLFEGRAYVVRKRIMGDYQVRRTPWLIPCVDLQGSGWRQLNRTCNTYSMASHDLSLARICPWPIY